MKSIILALVASITLGFAAEAPTDKPPFPKWDTDGDKALSREEWVARASARFEEVDANKDGKVTKEEASAAHQTAKEKRKARQEERKSRQEERKQKKDK